MPDKITQSLLDMSHQEWRAEENARKHALKLWGMWFKEVGGPENWRQYVDAMRGDK